VNGLLELSITKERGGGEKGDRQQGRKKGKRRTYCAIISLSAARFAAEGGKEGEPSEKGESSRQAFLKGRGGEEKKNVWGGEKGNNRYAR